MFTWKHKHHKVPIANETPVLGNFQSSKKTLQHKTKNTKVATIHSNDNTTTYYAF